MWLFGLFVTTQGSLPSYFNATTMHSSTDTGGSLPEDAVSNEPTDFFPDEVRVCMKQERVDFFSINEFREYVPGGYRYGCSWSTTMKEYRYIWTEGVTNAKETLFTLGDAVDWGEEEEEEDLTLEVCTFKVDGVECNTCALCGSDTFHLDGFEADCSNVMPGAVTSCDYFLDSMDAKLLVLQAGYIQPSY